MDNNQRRVIVKDPNSIKMNFSGVKYNNRFIIGFKEFKIIIKEQFTKLKITGCILAVISMGIIILFSYTFPAYKTCILCLLVAPVFYILYTLINIRIFISKIDPRFRKRKLRVNYDICLFKKEIIIRTSIHVEKFVFEKEAEKAIDDNDEIVDTKHLNYYDVIRLVESKQFIYIITKKEVYLINKNGRFRKRHGDSYDLMRKFLQEKSGVYLYISAYHHTKFYESYYEMAHKLNKNENIAKALIRAAVIFTLIPIFINTVSTVKFLHVWAFWVGLIACAICVIILVMLHHQKYGISPKRKVLLTASVIGIVSNLIFGIVGSMYTLNNNATVTKIRWLEPIINATLPTEYILLENSHVEKSIDETTYFRNEIVENYQKQAEITAFEDVISSENSKWLNELTAEQRKMLPYDAHTNIGDYYFFYDQLDKIINPNCNQVKYSTEMWYLTYDNDTSILYVIEYNIFNSMIYTA